MPQEPELVKLVETVHRPAVVVEVEIETVAEIGIGPEAEVVIEIEVGAGHKPAHAAGTVGLQAVDRDSIVDTAVGMRHIQDIAGSIVDIVAVDTIAQQLVVQ